VSSPDDPARAFVHDERADSTTSGDGYTPDPDRDSAYLVELFFERLGEDLAEHGLDPDAIRDLIDRARQRQRQLNPTDRIDLPDAPARYNRRYTSAVLAAYHVLSTAAASTPSVPTGPSLLNRLTRAFVEPLAETVTAGTRAMLDAAEDPFAAMVAVARTRESEDFGAEFVFSHPADDDDRFFADVHRCGYHEYFSSQNAPQLTPVLCAFDANWINAINPQRHGFTFTRVTTIGLGGRLCPFHFQRTGAAELSGLRNHVS
jgi:hypothetical protein